MQATILCLRASSNGGFGTINTLRNNARLISAVCLSTTTAPTTKGSSYNNINNSNDLIQHNKTLATLATTPSMNTNTKNIYGYKNNNNYSILSNSTPTYQYPLQNQKQREEGGTQLHK